ncbi:MAG: aminotransferase class V-fold PLP-dependent enzyme [Chromatiales bacterium]
MARLGPGPLTEEALVSHVHPLFSRVLGASERTIYLANHSLGRPPDQTAVDVAHALDLWYCRREEAWEEWLAERARFRAAIAQLVNASRPDCIVPRASAAQALRAVLNCYDTPLHVISTGGESGSIDHVLKTYARRQRVTLKLVGSDPQGVYHTRDILAQVGDGALVVVSMVFFVTGQRLRDLDELIAGAHARGARVLVDLYHAAGAVPVDITLLDADFAIGGCYKYLRGGPGAGFLYIHPRHLDGSLGTLDSGWFAQAEPFGFDRPEIPVLAAGGDAFLEATPAVLPFYQARAGLAFTLAVGVDRLRAYSLAQQVFLAERLGECGVPVRGDAANRGSFVAIPHQSAGTVAERLKAGGVILDAREGYLRLCPDVLNTSAELALAAEMMLGIIRAPQRWA